ncbi:MAG: VWA domain-containing protein [Candidatus Omnitrophota bacterium]
MKGQIGMGLVFLFLGGLMLSGFALDSGVIFLRRSQMQKILDSAALNGVAASVNGKSPQEVRVWVQRFIRHQATKQGIEMVGEANVDVQAPSRTSSLTKVRASVRANCNYLMAKFLSSFSTRGSSTSSFGLLVKAAAATSRRPVILSMVFDNSGSMGDIVGGRQKIVPARDAARQLVDVLSYPDDQMALISYSDSATVRTAPPGSEQGMLIVNEDGNADLIKNAIDGLAPGGWTNMAQGVLKGREQMEGAEVTPRVDYRRIVILFTDGVPNKVFTRFPDARVIYKPFFDSQDVETLGNHGNSNSPPQYFVDINRAFPACSGGSLTNDDGVANKCLERWTYLDSMGAAMGGGIVLSPGPLPTPGEFNFLRKISMDLTIREADYAKDLYAGDPDRRVTFYSVGLGILPPVGADPYEFATPDPSTVRGILLRKLANDPRAAADPQFIPGTSNLNGNQEEGQFYYTPDPATLAQTFKDIINADLKTIRVIEYDA